MAKRIWNRSLRVSSGCIRRWVVCRKRHKLGSYIYRYIQQLARRLGATDATLACSQLSSPCSSACGSFLASRFSKAFKSPTSIVRMERSTRRDHVARCPRYMDNKSKMSKFSGQCYCLTVVLHAAWRRDAALDHATTSICRFAVTVQAILVIVEHAATR